MERGHDPDQRIDRPLWTASVSAMAMSLAAALVLIILLVGGWNSPRPLGPPDWRAEGLPMVLAAPPGGTVAHLLPWSGDSFTLEAIVNCLSGPDFNGIGVIFQAEDAEDYDVFAISSDGYLAVLHVAGESTTSRLPWQQFPHIHRSYAENRLRLSCSGPTCRLYVNDEYAASVDTHARMGHMGVWASSPSSEPVTVAFTTIQVWETGKISPR